MAGSASVEIDPKASRVVTSAWPDTLHLKDIIKISDRDLDEFHSKFPRVNKVLIGMGAPCQDLSAAKVGRRGLEGERSSLFWDGVDLCERLQRRFPYIDCRRFVEQVASARGRDVEVMSKALALRPTRFDAALVSWVARPRLYWSDWEISWPTAAQCHQTREREVVWWPPVRGACSEWLRQGSRCQGEAMNRPLCTFLPWVPRDRAPSQPHGIHACNEIELARWRASGFAASPAQFRDSNRIHDAAGGLWMCTMNGREQLLGFPKDHTLAAVKSGVAKSNPGYEKACRLSLSGNSWSVPATAFQIGSLLAEWGFLTRPPTVEEVVFPRHLPLAHRGDGGRSPRGRGGGDACAARRRLSCASPSSRVRAHRE